MKNQVKNVIIYGLVSTGDINKIKYVGKTHQKMSKRIHDHIRESYKNKTKKDIWIQTELTKLNKIEYKVIEICNTNNWLIREKYWISQFDELTNTSKGGDGGRGLLAVKNYDELKKFSHSFMTNVTNSIEWVNFVKNNPQYNFLPKYPYASYKNRGWISWSDLLLNYSGTEKKSGVKKFFTYLESKKKLSELSLKNKKDFKKISKNLEKGIPTQPDVFYKRQGTWVSWGDFLSNGNKYHKNKVFISYDEAKECLKHLKLKSIKEYRKFLKTTSLIIPFDPDKYYKNSWINWFDFLSK